MSPPPIHRPPQYDIYGLLKPRKTELIPTRIPPSWDGPSKTKTDLLAERRKERLQNMSHDLDVDGVVGGSDSVVSKRFDLDGDRRLNTPERKAADAAVRNEILYQ